MNSYIIGKNQSLQELYTMEGKMQGGNRVSGKSTSFDLALNTRSVPV